MVLNLQNYILQVITQTSLLNKYGNIVNKIKIIKLSLGTTNHLSSFLRLKISKKFTDEYLNMYANCCSWLHTQCIVGSSSAGALGRRASGRDATVGSGNGALGRCLFQPFQVFQVPSAPPPTLTDTVCFLPSPSIDMAHSRRATLLSLVLLASCT